ncbi:MAG: cytochrome b561 domain-containing protein, partial [Pseudomonadota bacterium]
LFGSIDPTRPHHLDMAAAWHGRLMVAAWSFLFPIGILAARFFKIRPGQDWPRKLDTRLWWNTHLVAQYTGTVLLLAALFLAWLSEDYGSLWHKALGYGTVALAIAQVIAAWTRGSKGGPGEPSLYGDHYDMTRRRRIFEYWHKFMGYLAILVALAAMLSGLWLVNAYRWMVLGLVAWWCVLALAFIVLQRRGMAVDTYQAIWGPGREHPGNRMKPIGWGVKRPEV